MATKTVELTEEEWTKINLALTMRSNTLHNLADQYQGSSAGSSYREKGNEHSNLARKILTKLGTPYIG